MYFNVPVTILGVCILVVGATLNSGVPDVANPEYTSRILKRRLSKTRNDNTEPKAFYRRLNSYLESIQPRSVPKSVIEVVSRLKHINNNFAPAGYVEAAAHLISQGLASNDLNTLVKSFKKVNSAENFNQREPKKAIFPKKSHGDAPYSQTENEMRRQIFIPSTFTYGKKPPVILVPGTGERGGNSFAGNFLKTLRDQPYADIVWINPPGYQLDDAQVNGETVAYAINYISGICGNQNVTTIGWSQGSISMQWALKFWRSAQKVVSGVITFSGDYDGSLDANVLEPAPVAPLPPAIIQQKTDSNFVKALKSNDGDSAYVPTTTIYSSFFDEIVVPQHGKAASAYINDVRGVGVSNIDIQKSCPKNTPAGAFVDHESILFNPLTFALVEDALTNGLPALPSRINLKTVCQQSLAPGLTLSDALITESTIPFAAAQIALYRPKVVEEPEIKAYAR